MRSVVAHLSESPEPVPAGAHNTAEAGERRLVTKAGIIKITCCGQDQYEGIGG